MIWALFLLLTGALADESGIEDIEKFEAEVRRGSERAAPVPITRSEILQRADAIYRHNWQLQPENYQKPGQPSQCRPDRDRKWLRPGNLNGRQGQLIQSIPYKWGGYFRRLSTFNRHLQNGKLAGDICTCRSASLNWCLVYNATGLDCSGFVSSVWNIDYHTTASMHKVSAGIRWHDLKPGDALNKPRSHIMLFLRFLNKTKTRLKVIESSKSCNGVCESVYTVSELKGRGFQPIRFDYVSD